LRKEPLLANGGVTNLWARGLADASYRLEAEAYKLRVPVLVLRGEKDAIAIGRRQRDLCLRLVDCSLVTLAGARHKLFFEVDTVRAAALEHLLRFLDIRAVSKADAISALEERRL
jgi:alpha-beta hydrolase superfamily lysophospholipase